ncbi:restriction endonuclease subunit S [Ruegeria profundi]|uniref:Type I restriction modification DNA specificity domain-containing protein n=1 Tax=Ruegeria profundi TaxID=1685378 RepID=A0A0X3TPV5_9RHOB|nr:restriction endonuclease subunit S [Ruegeria profundi]KUJ77743.1 hypothetical protein AVO44_15540 [Ruegeria profundi]
MVKAGHKQTDAGLIPEDWEVLPFNKTLNIASGQVDPRKPPFCEFLLVAPDHIEEATGRLLERKTAFEQSAISGKYVFESGQIVYSKIRPYLRKLIFSDCTGLCSADMYPLSATTAADAKFCFYAMLGERFSNFASTISARSGIPKINREEISEFSFALPPKPEQSAIAGVLSDMDGLIAGLEALIAKKRAVKIATMQQLLTGKTRLPGYVRDWKEISIGKDARLSARIGWQALTTKEYMESGDYFLVTGTDFSNGAVDWSSCWFVDEWRYSQDRKIQLRAQDVLVTKDGTIGKAGYVEELVGPATLNSGVFVIRPIDNSFCPKFLYHVLTSRIFDEFIDEISAGSTITHLYQKDFVKFSFMAPEYDEQEEVSEVLSSMDQDISALEVRLSKTKALKHGVMQELLTGRTRLV